jgi:hypothetical protein
VTATRVISRASGAAPSTLSETRPFGTLLVFLFWLWLVGLVIVGGLDLNAFMEVPTRSVAWPGRPNCARTVSRIGQGRCHCLGDPVFGGVEQQQEVVNLVPNLDGVGTGATIAD